MKRTKTWSVALVATLIATAGVLAHAEEHKLTVKESDEFGKYVADAEGRALYMYTADTQGEMGTPAISNCYDTCADAWPPLVADKSTMEETGAQTTSPFQTTPQTTSPETTRPESTSPLGQTEQMVREGSEAEKNEIQKDLISTTQRRDGAMQVTYGGWPLYYYEKDTEAGQTNGQGVEDSGGEWYLIAPDGSKVEEKSEL